jgi:hypothetical protein
MLRTKRYSRLLTILVAGLLAGCSLPGSGTTVTGPCGNPLYPVIAGAQWEYQMTGTTTDTFTRSIVTVSESGFTDQDTFTSGVIRTGEWSCEAGNLINLDPVGSTSANVQTNGLNADFQTTAQSGVTLPASVEAGTTWTQSVSISGTIVVSGIAAEGTNDTSIACTASGMESVTVPAGTFDAMKVICQDSIAITVTTQGITVSVPPINFTTEAWYAPGVGWVKAISSGDGIDTTVTLTSYSLP